MIILIKQKSKRRQRIVDKEGITDNSFRNKVWPTIRILYAKMSQFRIKFCHSHYHFTIEKIFAIEINIMFYRKIFHFFISSNTIFSKKKNFFSLFYVKRYKVLRNTSTLQEMLSFALYFFGGSSYFIFWPKRNIVLTGERNIKFINHIENVI